MLRNIMAIATALSLTGTALAAQDYPAFDVNGVIQWGPGGAVDTVGRAVSAIAEQQLGRNIVMTNRQGGAGVIAVRHVLAQPADGYTLLIGSADTQLYKVLGLADVDYSEFYTVSLVVEENNLILVNSDSPYQTFADLLADVQAKPGEIRMANYGPGTSSHIVNTMLTSVTDFNANLVPFDGAGAAMTAAMGGAVEVVVAGVSIAKPMIESGRLRALAIVAPESNPHFPDVPPVTEFVPEIAKFLPWGSLYGVFADKDIPEDAKARLVEAFKVASADPEFTKTMDQRGVRILALSGDEAAAYLERWQSITSWLLHDAGAAKASPESFGIPKP
jgi:tripartite-type tricarboxylate transporter receptor subunit TctC